MTLFNLSIYAADHIVYEGSCQYISLPTQLGQYGVLARHRNTISEIEPGKLTYTLEGGQKESLAVSRGLLKIENGDVLVLVQTAEKPEEIDINRAKKAEENAKAALKKEVSQREYNMLQAKLARAFSREKIKKDYK